MNDMASATSSHDLARWLADRGGPAEACLGVIEGIAAVASFVADKIGGGSWPNDGASAQSDGRAVRAQLGSYLLDALQGAGVAYIAWADQEAITSLDRRGRFALTLVWSGVGGAGEAEPGLLFGLYPASPDGAAASFLRTGEDLLAAGYLVVGARTVLSIAVKGSLAVFVRTPTDGLFHLSHSDIRIAPDARRVAIDMANYRHWHHPVRLLVDDCIAGADGPRKTDYNFGWSGSAVTETHRILSAGGVYIDPPDHRVGHQAGGSRLVFEAFPIAFVIEQAGGAASDTYRRILSRSATEISQPTPLVFGSAAGVKLVNDYHLGPAARLGDAPLFGRRGLYRK